MGSLPILPMGVWVVMMVLGFGMAAPTSKNQPYSEEEESYKSCTSDLECDADYYCYRNAPDPEFHYCARCIDCNDYRRLPGWVSCVKSEDACGPCLPGFVTRGRHCGHPENDVELEVMRSSGSSGSKVPGVYIGVISGLATTVLVCGAIITSLLYKYGALSIKRQVQVPTLSKTEEGESDLSEAETEVLTGQGSSRHFHVLPSAPPKADLVTDGLPLGQPPPYSPSDSNSSDSGARVPFQDKFIPRSGVRQSQCVQASGRPASRRRANERNTQALPYRAGRAASSRTVQAIAQTESAASAQERLEWENRQRSVVQVVEEWGESMEQEALESLHPDSTENSYISEQSEESMDLTNSDLAAGLPTERSQPDGASVAMHAPTDRVQFDGEDYDDDEYMDINDSVLTGDADFLLRFSIPAPVPSPSTSEDNTEDEANVPEPVFPPNGNGR